MATNKLGKEALIGRAVVDPDFRKQLLADPEGTIQAGGYTVDQELIDQIKNLDPAAAEAAAQGMAGEGERRAAS